MIRSHSMLATSQIGNWGLRRALASARRAVTLSATVLLLGSAATTSAAQDVPMQAPPTPAMQAALQAYADGRLQTAQRRFERLASQGHALADHNLAVMHLGGETVGVTPKRRQALARFHMARAAQRGLVTAQHEWARMHEQGIAGPRDLAAARLWYERAARAGSVDAQVEMGTAYLLGRGLPKDAAQALTWYRQAAVGGDEGAQYIVASMYERGEGTRADLRLARYWYEAAARQGDVAAKARLAAWPDDSPSSPAAPTRSTAP